MDNTSRDSDVDGCRKAWWHVNCIENTFAPVTSEALHSSRAYALPERNYRAVVEAPAGLAGAPVESRNASD